MTSTGGNVIPGLRNNEIHDNAPPPPLPPRPDQQSHGVNQPNFYGSFGGMHTPFNSNSYYPYRSFGMNYRPYGTAGGYGGYENWLSQLAEDGPMQAFRSIETVVRAASSVSMMLESTYNAIFSSFQAIIGVASHLSQTKAQITQIISALAIIKTLRNLFHKFFALIGIEVDKSSSIDEAWKNITCELQKDDFNEEDIKKKKSSWPLFVFFGIIFGGPWIIWKVISSLTEQKDLKSWKSGEGDHFIANSLYSFTAGNEKELSFQKGQMLRLAPKEQQPSVKGWLLACGDGKRSGLIPANYVKIIERVRQKEKKELEESRVKTQSDAAADKIYDLYETEMEKQNFK